MAIDPNSISLTDAQRQALALLSEESGKPWPEVLAEALASYSATTKHGAGNGESFSAAAARLGLIGCVDGPADLSTNPTYLEGFGEREN